MSTTATRTFYCASPIVWPDPEVLLAKPTKSNTCWAEFDSAEARNSHIEIAHPEWWAEVHDIDEQPLPALKPARIVLEGGKVSGGGEPSGPADHGPSEKQLAYIASLAEQKGQEVPECKTKKAASAAIERLQGLPDAARVRKNRYAGTCVVCKSHVPEGEGAIRKDERTGRWVTECLSCPVDFQEAPEKPEVPDGRYAITAEEGHTSFYKVTAGRNPGVVFVDLLVGGDANGQLVRQSVPRANREAILAKIVKAGITEAAIRFGHEVGQCSVCGRGLTKEASRLAGIGPKCAEGRGWG